MFHKSLLKVLSAGILLTGMAACEKGINDDIITPQAEVKVTTPVGTLGKYFITSSPNTFKVPVGFTTVSNKDRTINLTYTSRTAVAGTHFNGPASVVIPAGQVADTIEIAGVFSAYPTGRKDTVSVSVSSPDAATAFSDNTYKVVLQKYCDVVSADLTTTFTRSFDRYGGSDYGYYEVTVTNWNQTSATKATATIEHLGEAVLGEPTDPINVVFDWTDPANFKVTIPSGQKIYSQDYYGYGPVSINAKSGTFSSCDKTITLTYTLDITGDTFGTVTTYIR